MAEVSVIIPAWRAANTIERALRSVATQTTPPKEAIVVDDGSDDGTFETAEACRAFMGDIGLTVIRQRNAGAGAARNRAIRESRGDLLAFLDADDEWLPTHLERSLAVMDKDEHVLSAHNSWTVDPDGTATLNDCAARFQEGGDPFVSLYRKGYIDTCTVLTRRDAVLAVGGFDETLPNAQDFDLWLKLLRVPNTRFTVFDEALCHYHVMPGSIMTHTDRRRRCCMEIARRYVPNLNSLLFRIAAIHYEAFSVQRNRKEWGAASGTIARLIRALFVEAAAFTFKRFPPVGAWAWIFGILALWLWQFKPMLGAIIQRLGGNL